MRRADGILSDSRFLGQPAAILENRALHQLSEQYLLDDFGRRGVVLYWLYGFVLKDAGYMEYDDSGTRGGERAQT